MIKLSAEEIFNIFVHRKDVFAKQQPGGYYYPERRPITLEDIENHMSGKETYGLYCLNHDNTIKWACIDIDIKKKCKKCRDKGVYIDEKDWKWVCPKCGFKEEEAELRRVKAEANIIFDLFEDFPRILEFSGRRGYHIWIFFKNPVQASFGQKLVKSRLNRVGLGYHEVFPKQTELNEGRKYGNLVKIPQGFHKHSGQKSRILKMEGL